MSERVLVTGVLGCLGAWVARAVLADGDDVVGYDLGENTARLDLVLGEDAARVTLVCGDITDLEALERVLDEHEITRVVHLAALQVPFVRANPPLGMRVNVAGTVNVFEAVSKRLDRIPGVAYASSTAVYNAADPSPAPEAGGTAPSTLYGVSKLADEGMARVYAADNGLPSIGLRPYVVYGPGRDQGMTSGPTMAMLAAARGEPYAIGYGAPRSTTSRRTSRVRSSWPQAPSGRAPTSTTPRGPRHPWRRWLRRSRRSCPTRRSRGPATRSRSRRSSRRSASTVTSAPFPRTPLDVGVATTIEHFRASG